MKPHSLLLSTAWLGLSLSLALADPAPARSDKAKSIFDGKSMEGWESNSPNLWAVKEGCLTGGDGNKIPYNDFLCTKASYSNFALHLKIKLTGDPKTGLINSGVQIRTQRNPTGHEVCGYQCDYGEPNWYAGIYDEGRRNKFIAPADMALIKPAVKLWDWNDYVIKADGKRIQTWINGVQGVDYMEPDVDIACDGIIGFQVHGGGNTTVQVKEVFVEELPATPDAPTWKSLGGVEGQRAKLSANPKPPTQNPKSQKDISYNVNDAVAKTPEEEQKTFKLPEGFEIELVAAESEGIGKFVTVDWDQKGRMWSMTALEYPVDGNENMEAAKALYAAHSKDKVLVWDKVEGLSQTLSEKDKGVKTPSMLPQPHIFADGLAQTLGILPYGNGVYVQHGENIEFREDTDGDGKADKVTTILTGFGVQDAHLFMHQFTRMPGGWIWGAQGAFNKGKVKTSTGVETDFPSTRMARFRPDGSQFEVLCTGPCNIWGFEVNGLGEMFIQEANDYGYPVMPFHIGANYPGCADRLFKSYAPPFPGLATFRMGGTGLSGLSLANKGSKFDSAGGDDLTMYVANPITRKIQAIKIKHDGPRYALEQLPDFIETTDPMFRPVGMHFGPDGALYIVDWYNKIISHNEVPRTHPDRDKTRGCIWRVKHKDQPLEKMPDLTKCAPEELLALLGSDNTKQSHLAWQAIIDRKLVDQCEKLGAIIGNGKRGDSASIQALWALEGLNAKQLTYKFMEELCVMPNRNIRREGVRILGAITYPGNDYDKGSPIKATIGFLEDQELHDNDPEVRAEIIHVAAALAFGKTSHGEAFDPLFQSGAIKVLISMAKPSLNEPMGPSTRDGKPIRIGEAYEREFERYLVRQALEEHPEAVEAFLASPEAEKLPLENRLLATLALEPKASAKRIATLLPQIKRAPNDEELLRLAQFPDEAGVGDALKAVLQNESSRAGALEGLLRLHNRLDAAKIAPLLTQAAKLLLQGDDSAKDLGLQLVSAFEVQDAEADVVALVKSGTGILPVQKNGQDAHSTLAAAALNALAEIRSSESALFNDLFKTSKDGSIRDAALNALARSKAADAGQFVITLWPDLSVTQRRSALDRLSSSKAGAKVIAQAVNAKTIKATELDGNVVDRLQIALAKDAELTTMMQQLGSLFRPVLQLKGTPDSFVETDLTLDGPFTVETWVKLNGKTIGAEDGILGSSGQLDLNFLNSQFRVWVGSGIGDAIIAKKKIGADNWTHVAVTRDEKGLFKIFINGELDSEQSKAAPQKFEHLNIGWTQRKKGTNGALAEYRIWNRVRTANEIRANFDRSFEGLPKPEGILYLATGTGSWGKLKAGAAIIRTSELPPLLTAEEAKTVDERFTKFRALANKPGGDPTKGKAIAAICMGCHLIQGQGGNIGPNISGAGTMGSEALLRRLITPNAALESAYRIYRVELKTGDVVDGFLVNEDKEAIILRQPGVPDKRVSRDTVREAKFIRRGMMPEGILDAMTPEMVTDLFSYLMSLKG